MSLRNEQYLALVKTQNLLRDMLFVGSRPKTVREMKARASSCLKHFPILDEVGAPIFSNDPFECPPINPPKHEETKSEVPSV